MSRSFYLYDHRRISLHLVGGMCIWDTVMAELGEEISNNDS